MWKSVILLAIVATTAFAATDKIVCYLGSWAYYRQGTCKFTVEDIDASSCTHIIYGFIGINVDGTIRIMDSWLEEDLGALKRFTGLRSRNSNLKSLVAIGGWNEGSEKFSVVVSNPTLRAKFIQESINFLIKYEFDGFDLDWEYPAQRGGAASDKANFAILLAEFRAALDKHGFLLTAAVGASAASAEASYDIPALSKYLDFINVMTYDLHGAWESVTGQNAPLYPSVVDVTETARSLTVDACITHWINKGADPQKLILGVGTYGRTFVLQSTSNTGVGAPSTGGGSPGSCTGEVGFLGYNEICAKLKAGGCTEYWDANQQVPYAVCGNVWIGYDNERSIIVKSQYAIARNLGGVMIWSVETDDFRGACGIVNPILNAIRTTLGLSSGGSNPTTAAPSPTTSTSTTTTTTAAPSGGTGNICTAPGYVRDKTDCSVFYQCIQGSSGYTAHRYVCPNGLYFDPSIIACNYPALVSC